MYRYIYGTMLIPQRMLLMACKYIYAFHYICAHTYIYLKARGRAVLSPETLAKRQLTNDLATLAYQTMHDGLV